MNVQYSLRARPDGWTEMVATYEEPIAAFARHDDAEAFWRSRVAQEAAPATSVERVQVPFEVLNGGIMNRDGVKADPVTPPTANELARACIEPFDLPAVRSGPLREDTRPGTERDAEDMPVSIRFGDPSATENEPEHRPRAPAAPKGDVDTEQLEAAFIRIAGGEKLGAVASDIGVTMPFLRARWAAFCQHGQAKVAEEIGQKPCGTCARPFTLSDSQPDLCARCAKEV